jgi:ribosomal-protein-alanine N-acetyltransferase
MIRNQAITVRPLTPFDRDELRHLFDTSEYVYHRFAVDELGNLLAHAPGVAAFSGTHLQAFLLTHGIVAPCAWISGFGVTWSESHRYRQYFDLLLPALGNELRRAGVERLYYSGNDLDFDWLKDTLMARQFHLKTTLRSYDKVDYRIPTDGNQDVIVRPFTAADGDGVLAVEVACFEPHWRYDAAGFLAIQATYPYFAVAEYGGRVIGYQFNTVEAGIGYLVRIAVHPDYNSQGIGARLMAEAVRFFASQHVWKIALNTEEWNTHAHRLYEWFGFHLVHLRGFVLERTV